MMDRRTVLRFAVGAVAGVAIPKASLARARSDIDDAVAQAIATFRETIPSGTDLIDHAKGMLIVPNVIKGGFVLTGAYGEGALIVGDTTESYYSVASAALGFQVGGQRYHQALFFMTEESLEQFRRSDGWEAGVNAEVTLLDLATSAGVSTATRNNPVIGLIFGQKGFLAGASFEGAKYSRIVR